MPGEELGEVEGWEFAAREAILFLFKGHVCTKLISKSEAVAGVQWVERWPSTQESGFQRQP